MISPKQLFVFIINLLLFIILPLSALIIVTKSIRYEDHTIVFDNESQYYYFYISLWLSLIIQIGSTPFVFIYGAMGGFPKLALSWIFLIIMFSIGCINILNGSVVDGLTVHLRNKYAIFFLLVPWFILLGGYLYIFVSIIYGGILREVNKKPLTPEQIEERAKKRQQINESIKRSHKQRQIKRLEDKLKMSKTAIKKQLVELKK